MKITNGQFASILSKVEKVLLVEVRLISTMPGRDIDYAEKALFFDELVNEINQHFKVKPSKKSQAVKNILAVECKFDLWAIKNKYPVCPHRDSISRAMDFLREDIKTEEDYQACLRAADNFRQERLKAESELSSNRKYTMRFSRWVKEWRDHLPKESDKPVVKVLDASELGF